MALSSEYDWRPVNQTRFHHSVGKAIEIIKGAAREVEEMSLKGWTEGGSGGERWVVGPGAWRCKYHAHKISAIPDNFFPVIVGPFRDKTLVLDGAHRVARSILLKKKAVPVIRLTEAEMAACVRPGMEKRVAELKLE